MTKPSRRSSVASALFRARPLRLALPALVVLVGFGLFVSGCGDDPAPTTPTPTPTTPAPTPPGVPTGLEVASTGPDYIEWTWTAVTGATAYDVQMSNTAENDFTATTTASDVTATSRRFDVPAETTRWARVRAKSAAGESAWSDAVSGTTGKAPLVLAMPTGLRVADRGHNFIEWTWNVVAGATGYEVQTRMGNANFVASDETHDAPAIASPKWRLTVEPETTHYARVRAVAGTGAEKVEGDWALAVEGTSEEQPIGVPTGLEVTGVGVDFIEWEWDAVPGATSYTWQLDTSPPYNFNPPSSTGQATATKHRASLPSGRVAHLRVRANIGTAPNQRRGEFSAGVSGTTEEPEPEAIATPTGLAASGPTPTTVSLNWSDVTNAETYEVQQRAGSSGNWASATCEESDDNEVDESECTATGLDRGTEYQFRVRAVPVDDDDDLLVQSAWSSPVSATTTGRATTGGGSGGLNVRWRSDANSITWNWDQAPGSDFEYKQLTGVLDTADPCATGRGETFYTPVSLTQGGLTGSSVTRLLCVRTTTTEGATTTKGEWSHSWAVTAPQNPGTPLALNTKGESATDHQVSHEVGTLTWATTFSNQPQFEYEFAYILDETEKTSDDWPAVAPIEAAAQQRCSAAADRLTETIEPGGSTTPTTFESTIDLEPYSRYLMCYRAVNETGRSDWAFNFAEGGAVYTRAAPPTSIGTASPTREVNAQGVPTGGATNFRLTWRVTVSPNAPKADDTDAAIKLDYAYGVVHTTGDNAATAADSDDVLEVCNGQTRAGLARINQPGTSLFQNVANSTTQFDVWHVFANNTTSQHYYLCVRTLNRRGDGGGNIGRGGGVSLWRASPGYSYRTPS